MLSVTAAYIHNPLCHSTRVARSLDVLKMWQIFLIAAVSIVPITSWTKEEPTWPTEEPTENPPTTTPEGCPIGWIDNGALGCYLFSADRMGLSWIEALEYCEEQVADHKNLFPIISPF